MWTGLSTLPCRRSGEKRLCRIARTNSLCTCLPCTFRRNCFGEHINSVGHRESCAVHTAEAHRDHAHYPGCAGHTFRAVQKLKKVSRGRVPFASFRTKRFRRPWSFHKSARQSALLNRSLVSQCLKILNYVQFAQGLLIARASP